MRHLSLIVFIFLLLTPLVGTPVLIPLSLPSPISTVHADETENGSENTDEDASSDNDASEEDQDNPNQGQINEWQEKKREAEQKLEETLQQRDSLSNEIERMDTQIYLTELHIAETEARITKTEEEMETLDGRIDGLDTSLDDLSETLINRIAESYKQQNVSLFTLFFDADSANGLLERIKYQQAAQDHNQQLLFEVQQAKLNYQDQKDIRERKRAQLASLQEELAVQQTELQSQRGQREQLLAVTQNDESTYRNLIAEADRQIAAFRNFVQSTGVGKIEAGSLGTGEGGWYLSQRDSRWAGNSMGSSNMSILDVGCFITSIAMVFRSYGFDMTPMTLATNPSYFLPRSAYMYIPSRFNGGWPGGKNYRNISASQISDFLSRGVPVISGVNGASHYIVLKGQDGGEYIMNDPIYGPDLKVSEYYGLSGPFGVFE